MSWGLTPGVPGAPEPRMYPRSGYFLVWNKIKLQKKNFLQTVKPEQLYQQNGAFFRKIHDKLEQIYSVHWKNFMADHQGFFFLQSKKLTGKRFEQFNFSPEKSRTIKKP